MGNLFGQTPPPAKVRYDVVLPTGCRTWEQLYCGDVSSWDTVAARYGMDRFAYTCDMYNCDREAVCLNYFKATLQPDKQAVTIERYKSPSVQVPVGFSVGLQTLLFEGFQLNEVIAAERGGLAVLVARKSRENMSQVAFPLIQLGHNCSSVEEDRKKESGKHRLLRRRSSSKKEHREGRSESRKRPSSSPSLEDWPNQDRQVPEEVPGAVWCLGVLHAPRRDMTIISCQLSPDLSQTAVLFYCQSPGSSSFCYTLHCYSNLSLQTRESPDEAHARAMTSAEALHKDSEGSEEDVPHLLRTVKLSRAVQPYFVYDPRYGSSRIAVANYECQKAGIVHELVLLSLGAAGEEDAETDVCMVKRGNLSLPSLFGNSRLNLLYSKDGELLLLQKLTDDRFGVTSFCDFYIFTSSNLTLIKYITLSLPGLFHICKVSYEPVFSRCGSYMRILDHRVTYDTFSGEDEEQIIVQIYQLPRIVNLMSQCRRVILQQVMSDRHIDSLPLPPRMKDFLRFEPLYN